ncbi:MAG: glycosyltransferase family 87 protein [Vicinamibacterales bacterium]
MPTDLPGNGLSRRQHRIIRAHLAFIPVYVWLLYVWPVFFTQLPTRATADQPHLVRDFLHFYVQGELTRQRDAHALYDIDAMAAAAERVLPGVPKNIFPPVYGPQVGLFFAPLSRLDYLPALYLWLALTLVGTAASVYLVWRSSEVLRRHTWQVAALALGAPGLHFALSFGQASVLGLVCFTWLWLALRSKHHVVAGLAVGALAYKPQLGIVLACVFVMRREWRIVSGAAVGVVLQLLAAWAYWGASIFQGYLRALASLPGVFDAMEPDKDLAYSLRALFIALHCSPAVALSLSLVSSVVVVAFAVVAWRPQGALSLRYAGVVLATLLVNPHLYGYDLLLALPAMLLAGAWAWEQGERLRFVSTLLVYAAPIVTFVVPGPPLLTPLALAGATAWTLGQSFLPRSEPHQVR